MLDFVHEYGAPEKLTFDGAMSQVGRNTLFKSMLRKMDIPFHVSSPRRPNENPAESKIRELKSRWYRVMVKKRVPRRLWDFVLFGFVRLAISVYLVQNMQKGAH